MPVPGMGMLILILTMPLRKVPLVNEEYYHVFNRSIAKQDIFLKANENSKFLELLNYYRFVENPIKFSKYLNLTTANRDDYLSSLYESEEQVTILSFALMPNHYHVLVKQVSDFGISNFIRLVQNSYASSFNLRNERKGGLFQSPFKAVRIETVEQLIHTARYIHLNPITSFVLKNPEELNRYPWTSYIDYLNENSRKFVDKKLILDQFKNLQEMKNFTLDTVDYQRNLKRIEHLFLE